uniref:Uncharacterized protein n=1 Tax=Sphaerodactylus townsendi TaxID=933632 RepID=A0ACB8F4W0_9SAUR
MTSWKHFPFLPFCFTFYSTHSEKRMDAPALLPAGRARMKPAARPCRSPLPVSLVFKSSLVNHLPRENFSFTQSQVITSDAEEYTAQYSTTVGAIRNWSTHKEDPFYSMSLTPRKVFFGLQTVLLVGNVLVGCL